MPPNRWSMMDALIFMIIFYARSQAFLALALDRAFDIFDRAMNVVG